MKENVAIRMKKVINKKTKQKKELVSFTPVAGKVMTTVLLSAALSNAAASPVQDSEASSAMDNKIELADYGIYNGLKIYYEDFEAVDLGHIFESKMNPMAVGSGGKYLGLYQMDTGTTMQRFLEGVKDKYPELYRKGPTAAARKSAAFLNEWKKLSSGEKAKEFKEAQYRFMYEAKYRPVFEKLNVIPGLSLDKRGKVLEGAMMSAINQFSATNVIKFAKQAMVTARLKAAKNKKSEVPTAYIVDGFYKARIDFVNASTRMPESLKKALKARFREENKLAQAVLQFYERRQQQQIMEAQTNSKTYQITLNELGKAAPLSSLAVMGRLRKTNTL